MAANAATAVVGVAPLGRQTQLDYSPVLGSPSPTRPNTGNPVGHATQGTEDDQWRKDLLATLNNKLATRELLASEGVNAADLHVLDAEIAAMASREGSAGEGEEGFGSGVQPYPGNS